MRFKHGSGYRVYFVSRSNTLVARARNMSELARETGMTRTGLYRALDENGNPTLATVVHVLKALGCRLSVAPLNDEQAA